jgi:O-antigen ligase
VLVARPWSFHLIPLAGLHFGPIELAIGCAAVGRLTRLLLDDGVVAVRREVTDLWSRRTLTLPVLAIVLAAVISLATVAEVDYRRESLREFRLVIVEPIIFFLLARIAVRRESGRALAVLALLGTGVATAVWAVGQTVFEVGGVSADTTFRARAAYPHPNNLAFYLERLGVFALALGLLGGGRLAGAIGRWAALILAAGLVCTFSRGAALGFAAGTMVVLLIRRERRLWVVFAAAAAVVVVVSVIAARDRLLAAGGEGTVPTRVLIWRSSLAMALDYPIFGVGLDQFLPQYWRRYVEPAGWPERYTSHPHNLILDLWLRLGILGLAAFTWLGGVIVVLALAAWRAVSQPAERVIAVGAIAALVAGLVHGLVDNAFFLPDLAVMTWMFIVLIDAQTTGGNLHETHR